MNKCTLIAFIALIFCGIILLTSEKTTGSIDSVASNYCKIGKHSHGKNYHVTFVVNGKNYIGTSECSRKEYNNGDKIEIYYSKLNNMILVPYTSVRNIALAIVFMLIIFLYSEKSKSRNNYHVRN